MNKLEILCLLHNQQGGTIHQFNEQYGKDLLALSDIDFLKAIGIEVKRVNKLSINILFNGAEHALVVPKDRPSRVMSSKVSRVNGQKWYSYASDIQDQIFNYSNYTYFCKTIYQAIKEVKS